MSSLFWLTNGQMERLKPFFPKCHGKPRVDDPLPGSGLPANRERGRVFIGIIFINRNGLRWCDAPREHGPAKTHYNRWKRCGDMDVFAGMMEGLAAKGSEQKTIKIDATYLKADRTASSLRGKKSGPATSAGVLSGGQRVG